MNYKQRSEVFGLIKEINNEIHQYFQDKNIYSEGIDPRYATYKEQDIEDLVHRKIADFCQGQREKEKSLKELEKFDPKLARLCE